MLYDGDCPICRAEIRWLEGWNHNGNLEFRDINHADFDPALYGKTQEELLGVIHVVTPNGEMLTGMDAFRTAYTAVGLGWVLTPTGWPIVRPIFDRVYAQFAHHRIRLGRIFSRNASACDSGTCKLSV
jgi:predicted DCC family thiol-disulfide oxidoreductase YuxK